MQEGAKNLIQRRVTAPRNQIIRVLADWPYGGVHSPWRTSNWAERVLPVCVSAEGAFRRSVIITRDWRVRISGSRARRASNSGERADDQGVGVQRVQRSGEHYVRRRLPTEGNRTGCLPRGTARGSEDSSQRVGCRGERVLRMLRFAEGDFRREFPGTGDRSGCI